MSRKKLQNYNDQTIAKRFRLLRGPHSLAYAAGKANVSDADWQRWEKEIHKPTPRSAHKVAAGYGVDFEWLYEGKGPSPISREKTVVLESPGDYESETQYRNVAVYHEGIPGGPGRIIEIIKAELIGADEQIKIPEDRLKKNDDYVVFRVVGDSMEPLIKERDLVLVNLSRQDPSELVGKPVLAWLGTIEGATIKLLDQDPEKRHWLLKPTKEGYKDRIINKTDSFQVAAIEAAWLNFK